jgi:hypothetical protein
MPSFLGMAGTRRYRSKAHANKQSEEFCYLGIQLGWVSSFCDQLFPRIAASLGRSIVIEIACNPVVASGILADALPSDAGEANRLNIGPGFAWRMGNRERRCPGDRKGKRRGR